jgi:hypothetical protein
VKPGFLKNETLAECDPLARILFVGLWCCADRDGRLEDRPRLIKAECLPYDECDIEALLAQLIARGFVRRYVADGQKMIDIPNFKLHQNPHRDEKPRDLPAFPESNDADPEPAQCKPDTGTVQAPCKHRATTEVARLIPDS